MDEEILMIVLFKDTFHIFRKGKNGILKSELKLGLKDSILEIADFLRNREYYSFRSNLKEGNPNFEEVVKKIDKNVFITKECIEQEYIQVVKNNTPIVSSGYSFFVRFAHADSELELPECQQMDIGVISLGKYSSPTNFFKSMGIDVSKEEWIQPILLKLEVENL